MPLSQPTPPAPASMPPQHLTPLTPVPTPPSQTTRVTWSQESGSSDVDIELRTPTLQCNVHGDAHGVAVHFSQTTQQQQESTQQQQQQTPPSTPARSVVHPALSQPLPTARANSSERAAVFAAVRSPAPPRSSLPPSPRTPAAPRPVHRNGAPSLTQHPPCQPAAAPSVPDVSTSRDCARESMDLTADEDDFILTAEQVSGARRGLRRRATPVPTAVTAAAAPAPSEPSSCGPAQPLRHTSSVEESEDAFDLSAPPPRSSAPAVPMSGHKRGRSCFREPTTARKKQPRRRRPNAP
jgi:hypothetical protein